MYDSYYIVVCCTQCAGVNEDGFPGMFSSPQTVIVEPQTPENSSPIGGMYCYCRKYLCYTCANMSFAPLRVTVLFVHVPVSISSCSCSISPPFSWIDSCHCRCKYSGSGRSCDYHNCYSCGFFCVTATQVQYCLKDPCMYACVCICVLTCVRVYIYTFSSAKLR